jgi:hypothetical protein
MAHEHPAPTAHHHLVHGFGADRAALYDTQASINLAGARAAYELGVSALTAQLDGQDAASLLYVGLGTGAELVPMPASACRAGTSRGWSPPTRCSKSPGSASKPRDCSRGRTCTSVSCTPCHPGPRSTERS